MTRDEIIQKHKQYLFSCVTTYYKDPLVIDHAKGQYVYDLDGRQYLDFLGGIVTISVGHANEKVVLTGEGSDETLAGYTRYAWTLLNSKMDRTYRATTTPPPRHNGD